MNSGLMGAPISRALHFTLNGLSRRQQVVSNNVSNVDTPGFKASAVPFEAQLKAAMSKTNDVMPLLTSNGSHIQRDGVGLGDPNVVTTSSFSGRVDQNAVDIEREMFQLADTNIRYQTMAKVVKERLAWLSTAINSGGH